MSLDIDIMADVFEAEELFRQLSRPQLLNATKRAMNKTIVSIRQESMKRLRKKLKIKESSLRQRHIFLNRAKGGSMNSLEASVEFSGFPIPALEFVKGNKDAIKQKGIPIHKRRKLRLEITPGKVFRMEHAFIQRKFTKQVFKRGAGRRLKKQGTPSVGQVVKQGMADRLRAFGAKRFATTLHQEIQAILKGYAK